MLIMKDMQTNSPSPITLQLADMVLKRSLPCTRCGYDLNALAADGDCPECSEPIRLTIIDAVDPAARRLPPIEQPRTIGYAIVGVSTFLLFAIVCAVLVFMSRAPTTAHVPQVIQMFSDPFWVCASSALAVLALISLMPLLHMCRSGVIQGCRLGIILTATGLLVWSLVLGASRWILFGSTSIDSPITPMFDTVLPAFALSLTFFGLRILVPRLGQRSRDFRLAQGGRQRMMDLLAALVFVVIGRTCVFVSQQDSNFATLGVILMVLSVALIIFGLLYLVRNTLWIKASLCSPPPSIAQLLRSSST